MHPADHKGQGVMTGRTISLAPNLDREVRRKQTEFMLQTNRDCSYTETVNVLLAAGLAVKPDGFPDVERYQELLEGSDFDSEALLNGIQETRRRRKWETGG